MVATVTVVRRGNADAMLHRMKSAIRGPSKVKVGFPMGAVDGEELQKAVWQEFGTAGGASGGGWGGPIPERPFFRNAMRENRDRYRRLLASDGRKILLGEMMMTTTLNRLGLVAQGDVQESIASNTPPPLSPVTIERKGSTKTLIDTGAMRQSVTYEVQR